MLEKEIGFIGRLEKLAAPKWFTEEKQRNPELKARYYNPKYHKNVNEAFFRSKEDMEDFLQNGKNLNYWKTRFLHTKPGKIFSRLANNAGNIGNAAFAGLSAKEGYDQGRMQARQELGLPMYTQKELQEQQDARSQLNASNKSKKKNEESKDSKIKEKTGSIKNLTFLDELEKTAGWTNVRLRDITDNAKKIINHVNKRQGPLNLGKEFKSKMTEDLRKRSLDSFKSGAKFAVPAATAMSLGKAYGRSKEYNDYYENEDAYKYSSIKTASLGYTLTKAGIKGYQKLRNGLKSGARSLGRVANFGISGIMAGDMGYSIVNNTLSTALDAGLNAPMQHKIRRGSSLASRNSYSINIPHSQPTMPKFQDRGFSSYQNTYAE